MKECDKMKSWDLGRSYKIYMKDGKFFVGSINPEEILKNPMSMLNVFDFWFWSECYRKAKGDGLPLPEYADVFRAVNFIAKNLKDRCNINELEGLMSYLRILASNAKRGDSPNAKVYDNAYDILKLLLYRWGIIKNQCSRMTVLEIDSDLITVAIKDFLSQVSAKVQEKIMKDAKDKMDSKNYADCRNGAIRISTLRDNPNYNEYSREDISIGSVVKINDGKERFWVRVTSIGSCYIGTIANDLISDNGYDFGDTVVFTLSEIWDIEEPSLKPEDTYKTGDRVVFVKNRIYKEDYKNYVENVHLGILKNYSVNGYGSGNQHCTLEKMFHVMNISGLNVPKYLWGEDISNLIEKELFEKSLEPAPVSIGGTVYGLLEICPIDEKHFPKLNSIIAKISKSPVSPHSSVGRAADL